MTEGIAVVQLCRHVDVAKSPLLPATPRDSQATGDHATTFFAYFAALFGLQPCALYCNAVIESIFFRCSRFYDVYCG